MSVTGHGGSGEGGQNYGVWFSQSTIQAGGDGGVTIEGHGGNKDTGSENHGVVLGLSNIASNGAGAVLVEGWGGRPRQAIPPRATQAAITASSVWATSPLAVQAR